MDEFDVFIRYNEARKIVNKVLKFGELSMSELVSSRNPFGLSTSTRGDSLSNDNSLAVYSSKGVGFVEDNTIFVGREYISKYKVLCGRILSEHALEPDKDGLLRLFSTIRVLSPNEICTDSYLVIGKFDSKDEANNLSAYMKTRFFRILILAAASSINLSMDKFVFVPQQDFHESWTDDKLYAKYGITTEERTFIESLIKPME